VKKYSIKKKKNGEKIVILGIVFHKHVIHFLSLTNLCHLDKTAFLCFNRIGELCLFFRLKKAKSSLKKQKGLHTQASFGGGPWGN